MIIGWEAWGDHVYGQKVQISKQQLHVMMDDLPIHPGDQASPSVDYVDKNQDSMTHFSVTYKSQSSNQELANYYINALKTKGWEYEKSTSENFSDYTRYKFCKNGVYLGLIFDKVENVKLKNDYSLILVWESSRHSTYACSVGKHINIANKAIELNTTR